MNTPCYKCEDRKLLCHSSCTRYDAFKRELEYIKSIEMKDRIANSYSSESANIRAKNTFNNNKFKRYSGQFS